MDEVGDRLPVVNGIYADGSLEAARLARMAARGRCGLPAGVPAQPHGDGRPAAAGDGARPFPTIAAATDLPIILFQYPLASGLGYPFETLLRLVEEVPPIRAIKDWCADPELHERHIRTLQCLPRPVTVLIDPQRLAAELAGAWAATACCPAPAASSPTCRWRCSRRSGPRISPRAQAINERMYPLQQAFYAPPFLDMHNRMKEALVLLGRLPRGGGPAAAREAREP